MPGYFLLDRQPQGPRKWYPTRAERLRVIVMHITAGLQDLDRTDDDSAEATARYCATTDRQVSWHSGSDADSFIRLLPASYTAFHARGYNSFTYGHEISKKHTTWTGMDPLWVTATLNQAAACIRPVAAAHAIPPVLRSRREVDAGKAGFTSHARLDPDRRSDPGIDFPWERFLGLLSVPGTPTPPPPFPPPTTEELMARQKVTIPAGQTEVLTSIPFAAYRTHVPNGEPGMISAVERDGKTVIRVTPAISGPRDVWVATA